MKFNEIKHSLWDNSLTYKNNLQQSGLARLLNLILPMPIEGFVIPKDETNSFPSVFLESQEVETNMELADLIFEELGINLQSDSVVMMLPSHIYELECKNDISYWAGFIVGEVLVKLANREDLFPIHYQLSALYAMVGGFHEMSGSCYLRHNGMCQERFQYGLSASMCCYSIGVSNPDKDRSGMFFSQSFLVNPELIEYYTTIDPYFTPLAVDKVSVKMVESNGSKSSTKWVKSMAEMVNDGLELSGLNPGVVESAENLEYSFTF